MDYEMILKDYGYQPKYQCPLCKKHGLVFVPGEMDPKIPLNICHSCGYIWRYKRIPKDEKIWLDSWKENGSIYLYDLPIQERCVAFLRILDSFYHKKYIFLSEDQIKNGDIDNRVFKQHGLKKVKRDKKIVVSSSDGNTTTYNYDTNNIVFIVGNEGYISLVEECKMPYLLVSDYLSKSDEGVSNPIRRTYIGLVPNMFSGVYSLINPCILKGKNDILYTISIE